MQVIYEIENINYTKVEWYKEAVTIDEGRRYESVTRQPSAQENDDI